MRSQFLLIPAAVIAAAPAEAYQFLTLRQAQDVLFPGATFTPVNLTLDTNQFYALMKASDVTVWSSRVKAWRVSTGGWLFIDQVLGRDDRITYVVALDDTGKVKGVEVLECLAGYEQVRQQEWLGQFKDRTHASGNLVTKIKTISGTTLSCEHIAEGVRRILATFALFYAPKPE